MRRSSPQQAVRLAVIVLALILIAIASAYQSAMPLFNAIVASAQGLDPRCGDRNAKGQITCIIDRPDVTRRETVYRNVVFAPGDRVDVKADGCVQTGGFGNTWKRYVNPSSDSGLYHGLIRIPTGTKNSALVRIKDAIGQPIHVTGAGVPVSDLVLYLGYEDDDYSDNGYSKHDDGTDDQCKTNGGPARVTITIYRSVPDQTTDSRFDFDVLSNSVDANGLLYNPFWSWQLRPSNRGQIPNTSLCHDFSKVDTVAGIPKPALAPSFADCTDQADSTSVDLPDGINQRICSIGSAYGLASGSFVGHVNWFPVTLEGNAGPIDHGTDDDYTFTFDDDENGNPLSVNSRTGLHVEFDSEETIDNFSNDEWLKFKNAVDDDNHDLAKQLFVGHTILTGMFGLDGEHGLKAELHPLYALATRRADSGSDPSDDAWLMFVRNRGDEGFCSSQLWDAGFEDYTFRLPWLPGMSDVDVNSSKTQFECTDGASGPVVAKILPPAPGAGVYVTFHLGPSSSSPLIDGVLHLAWKRNPGPTIRGVTVDRNLRGLLGTNVLGRGQSPAENEAAEAESKIRAAIKQLPPLQRRGVEKARVLASVRPAMHRLPPSDPIRSLAAPPVARRLRLRAIKAGPATQKAQRDAAQIRALCVATHNAPAGLPPGICDLNMRQR